LFIPNKEQRHIKEVSLNTAANTYGRAAFEISPLAYAWRLRDYVAETIEAFFYTDPNKEDKKEE